MKDTRVTVWTNPTTHSTGSTSNTGPTIDLFASGVPAGGTYNAMQEDFGIGVQIFQTNATGTGQVTVWTYDWSTDANTWRAGGTLVVNTLDTASEVFRSKHTLRAKGRYVRLVATNTGTGTSTSNCYAEDFGGLFAEGAEVA